MLRSLLLLAALLLSLAASAQQTRSPAQRAPAPSRQQTPIERVQPQPSTPGKESSSEQRGTEQAPLVVKVAPAEDAEKEKAEAAAERKERAALDHRVVDLTADLVRATDDLAGFTRGLFYATIVLGIATAGLLVMGFYQSRDTKAALKLGRDEFEATHRPKIRLKHLWAKNDVFDDEMLEFEMVFTNVGDAPARLEFWGFATVFVPDGEDIPARLEYQIRKPPPDRILMPNGMTFVWGVSDGRVLTKDELFEVRNGGARLFCIGHIQYLDTTDTPKWRRTNFCRLLETRLGKGLDNKVSRLRVHFDSDYEYED